MDFFVVVRGINNAGLIAKEVTHTPPKPESISRHDYGHPMMLSCLLYREVCLTCGLIGTIGNNNALYT